VRGAKLIGRVDRELAVDLDLFTRGGLEILRAIERRQYDVLSARPTISKQRKALLPLRALAGRFVPGLRPAGHLA
jgi:phytoene/squalene synthetase